MLANAPGPAIILSPFADRSQEPAVLCVTTLCLGLFAALVCVGCAVAWHAQAWALVKPAKPAATADRPAARRDVA
jgi:hypothetical protein